MSEWLKGIAPNLVLAARRWHSDNASSLAAAVAYYLALSLFPMMLLMISGFGLFLQYSRLGQDAEHKFLETVAQYGSPVIRDQFAEVIGQLRDHSMISGPFGLLAGIFAAIGVFAQFDQAFDRIWRIPERADTSMIQSMIRIVKDRSSAFLMLLGLGLCVVMLFCIDIAFGQATAIAGSHVPMVSEAAKYIEFASTLIANSILFALVFKWLPKKQVSWQHAVRGGLLTALIWQLGRTILGVFLIGMRYTSAYGAVGSFIALLLWCYYGVSIIFFGAEYVQVLQLKQAGVDDASVIEVEQQTSVIPTKIRPRSTKPVASAVIE